MEYKFKHKTMKKLLLLLSLFVITANAQCNDVDITSQLQGVAEEAAEHHINLGNFNIITDDEGNHTRECGGCETPQTLNVSAIDDVLEIDANFDSINIYNANLVLNDGVVLITNNDVVFHCTGEIITLGNAQVYNTIEEYNSTLGINDFILNNRDLPFRLENSLGQTVLENITTLRGLNVPVGMYTAYFKQDNGIEVKKTFIKRN